MKRIVLTMLIVAMIVMGIGVIVYAQNGSGDEIFIVEKEMKLYESPQIFSKVHILQVGTVLKIDPFFEDEAFIKVIMEDGELEEGYVVASDLYSGNVSPASSSDLSTGEGSTASARGSMGQDNSLSIGSLDFYNFGDISNVNRMEQKTANISAEMWENFRMAGLIGEFLKVIF